MQIMIFCWFRHSPPHAYSSGPAVMLCLMPFWWFCLSLNWLLPVFLPPHLLFSGKKVSVWWRFSRCLNERDIGSIPMLGLLNLHGTFEMSYNSQTSRENDGTVRAAVLFSHRKIFGSFICVWHVLIRRITFCSCWN